MFRSRYIKNDKDVLFSKDLNCLVPLLKANILHCQQQQNYVINYPWVLNCWLDKKQFTDVTFRLAACDGHVFHFITQTTDRLMGKKKYSTDDSEMKVFITCRLNLEALRKHLESLCNLLFWESILSGPVTLISTLG